MNKNYLTLILTIVLLTSCVTFNADGSEFDWPMLSKQNWEKMNPERLEYLIDSGIDVNEESHVGFTALMLAAELNNNPDVVEILISEGADPGYETSNGQTVLMSAAINERTDEMINALASSGVDVNIENEYGLTALSVAFMFGDRPENLMTLLSLESPRLPNNIPVDSSVNYRSSRGYNKLMFQLRNNCDLDTAAELINAGVNLNARDAAGWGVGTIAAVYNTHPEVLKLLNENSVDLKISSEKNYNTLMLAAARNPEPAVISKLIESGEDVNAITVDGYTALMFAASIAVNDEVIIALLDAGADATLETSEGVTAWDFIQENTNLKGSRGYWELNDRRLE